MANIKDLLSENRPNAAASALYDLLFQLFNTKVPGVDLTKDEFDMLIPLMIQKIKDPDSVKPEPTSLPGDDIVLKPAKATITVTYTCDDEDVEVPLGFSKTMAIGQDYAYESPEVAGYVPDRAVVEGKMIPQGVNATVKYIKIPDPPSEPVEEKFAEVKSSDPEMEEKWTVETSAGGSSVTATFAGELETDEEGVAYAKLDVQCPYATSKASCDLYDTCTATCKWRGWSGTEEVYNMPKVTKCNGADPGKLTCNFTVRQDVLDTPNSPDGKVQYTLECDWNGDGIVDQVVAAKIDPKGTTLKEKVEE